MHKWKMIWNFRILISESKSSFWNMRERIYLKNPKYQGTLMFMIHDTLIIRIYNKQYIWSPTWCIYSWLAACSWACLHLMTHIFSLNHDRGWKTCISIAPENYWKLHLYHHFVKVCCNSEPYSSLVIFGYQGRVK